MKKYTVLFGIVFLMGCAVQKQPQKAYIDPVYIEWNFECDTIRVYYN